MPASTPALGIPYPLPADAVADYPGVGLDLAETLEKLLAVSVAKVLSVPTNLTSGGSTPTDVGMAAAYTVNTDPDLFAPRPADSIWLTVQEAGWYLAIATITNFGTVGTTDRWGYVQRDNPYATYWGFAFKQPSASVGPASQVVALVDLAAGAGVSLRVGQNTPGVIALAAGAASLLLVRLGGLAAASALLPALEPEVPPDGAPYPPGAGPA
jgi:hypothetical protein